MSLSNANRIWNRAALENGGESPSSGDRALANLLLLHGLTMNGGLLHAIEVLSPAELESAKEGFEYFGFQDVAHLIDSASKTAEGVSDVFTQQYWRYIPTDGTITHSFEVLLMTDPGAFSPLK